MAVKAKETMDHLVKTKEELHVVMRASHSHHPPPPPFKGNGIPHPGEPAIGRQEYTSYRAELSSEEKQIAEAEKSERVQRQLMILSSELSQARSENKRTHTDSSHNENTKQG